MDYLKYLQSKAAPELTEFHGSHDQSTHGNWANGRSIPVTPYQDEDKEYERVQALNKHYGRGEMAPEMGGMQWAFEGGSPPITEAAQDVLQGYPYDHWDQFRAYTKDDYDAADSILKTIESESSDVPLFSGHRRPRDIVEEILQNGVAFPLVATSPDRRLAEQYAGQGSADTVSIVYEFPRGSQAGYYQANEHIATGEYEVDSYDWTTDNTGINIKLRQTIRNTVPEKIDLEEE